MSGLGHNIFDVDDSLMAAMNDENPAPPEFEGESDSAPPNNIEAEQSLLGALLNDNRLIDDLPTAFASAHFYEPVHGRIFDAIAAAYEKHGTAGAGSPMVLKTQFKDDAALIEVGGAGYLADLAAAAVSMASVARYAMIVTGLHQRREAICIAHQALHDLYKAPVDADASEILDGLEQHFHDIAEMKDDRLSFTLDDSLGEVIDRVEAAHRGEIPAGISTGFDHLDQLVQLRPGEMNIIGARTAMGKTALGLNITLNVASANEPIAYFGTEMAPDLLVERILAMRCGFPLNRLKNAGLTPNELTILNQKRAELRGMPLYLQKYTPTVESLKSRVRRLVRRKGVKVVVVDYVQRLAPSYRKQGGYERITEAFVGCKTIAADLGISVLCLAQLNRDSVRNAKKLEDYRPQMTNLTGSDVAENEADSIMLLHRPEYYLDKNEPSTDDEFAHMQWQAQKSEFKDRAFLYIDKNRHGPADTVGLNFHAPTLTFRGYS